MTDRRTGHGHTLWLTPKGAAGDRYAALIRKLGRKYGSPVFDPHITLLPGLEGHLNDIRGRAQQVAGGTKSFEVTLTEISTTRRYFQRLFVRAEKSAELLKLRTKAEERFELSAKDPFEPHLSLLYGDPELNNAQLLANAETVAGSFQVNSIELYATRGPPTGWRLVETFDFGG